VRAVGSMNSWDHVGEYESGAAWLQVLIIKRDAE
jgi:hypothetical protein